MEGWLSFAAAFALWTALVIFFHWRRIWLLYYTVASVGLALLVVFAGTQLIPLERWLEVATAFSAHWLSLALAIPTRVFEASPGNILVWVVVQNPGWTVVRVDLECSGLLELAVLTGLVLFYPSWSLGVRTRMILIGWVTTFIANVIRVISIILILHAWGKPSIFIAHTIAGRLIFFLLVAGIYWLILTRPTLRSIRQRLQQRMVT